MSRGRKTLQRIDAEIGSLLKEEQRVSREVADLSDRIDGHREQVLAAFRELAVMRLGEDTAEALGGRLTRAAAEIERVRQVRRTAIGDLQKEIEANDAEIRRQEAERARLSREIASLHARIDAGDAELLETLAEDPDYKARIDAVETAEAVAVEAERKAELARDDRVEKGAPYEADPLFMYLWERGYGTQDYRGRGLTRMLDGWVARLIRYHDARPNYYMLLEIPERLGEHARRAREAAEEEAAALIAFEAEKRSAAGLRDLDEQADADEAALAKATGTLNELIANRTALQAKQAIVNRGEDEGSKAAIGSIVEILQDTSLKHLHREALLTPDPRDEQLVERIDDLRDDIEDLEHDFERRRKVERDLENKLAELQEVRGRFVGERFDDDRWEFDDDMVEDFLKELVRGVVTGAAVWAELRRRGHYTPGPTRPRTTTRRGAPWGLPQSGGGSIFRPRGGSSRGGFGGGGFRTGGGFGGGGGFRTGGGF